jgi:hypothetical protein
MFSIGPPGGFHLDEAKVDPQLNLFFAIGAEDSADFDLAGLMRPISEQVVKVQTHCNQYRNEWRLCQRVDEAGLPSWNSMGLKRADFWPEEIAL